jgi:hypothetical protein
MGLINLLTDPKNFKFYNGGQGYTGNGNQPGLTNIPYGKDRIDGGSSGQPYIQIPIPDDISNLGAANKDFILRGGTLAVSNSATDALRLTKMFGDLKSPSGLLFIAKQQLLSRTAVRTQASGKELNEGIYNPLTTIAQAGAVAFGTHLNKQSLIIPYSEVVTNNQQSGDNRLVRIYSSIINNGSAVVNGITYNENDAGVNIISYPGGPGSTLGIGKTNIRFADQRTGENNPLYNSLYFTGNNPTGSILNYEPVFSHNRTDIEEKKYFSTIDKFKSKTGVSQTYSTLVPLASDSIYPDGRENNLINNQKSVYTQGNTFPKNSSRINDNNTYVYTQQDIIRQIPVKGTYDTTQDFRAVLKSNNSSLQTTISKQTAKELGQLTNAPSYNIGDKQTIETRVNLGDPGNRAGRNYSSYTTGVTGVNEGALDKINAFPIYRSEKVTSDPIKNDLCKFRIAVIDNNEPTYKTFVHFRAFLDSISDSYTADWNATKYLGRGENFYNYNGFTRQISLSWTVAAQSRQELIPMYKKLNYLASSLTPEYSLNGYMRGNMVQLTIGGYLYEQPGIITGLTYNIEENTTWEIGINDTGGSVDENAEETIFDSSVKELPHILRVTGFNFIPIHRFRPEIQNSGDENDYKHFIALANGEGAQKNNYGSAIPDVADTIFRATDPPVNDLRGTGVISPLLRPQQQPGFIGPVLQSRDQQILNSVLSGNPLLRFRP